MAAKQGFGSVFSAEMKRVPLKPKRIVTAVLFAIAAILLFIGMTAVIDWTVNEAANQGIQGTEDVGSVSKFLGFDMPLSFISFCFGIYAAAFAARDYNDGTIMATLLAIPNRGRLFMARLLPWVFLSFVFSLIAFGAIAGIGIYRTGTEEAMTIALQGLLATVASMFTTIIGFCCGTITKKGSLAVFLFVGLFFLVPTIIGMAGGFGPDFLKTIVDGISLAMPGNAFGTLPGIIPLDNVTTDTWISLGVSIAWVVVAPILSFALFKSRGTLGR